MRSRASKRESKHWTNPLRAAASCRWPPSSPSAPARPAATFGALAAAIGGVVLLGSNATTWTQMEAAREAAEKLRADLIGGMELRVVDSGIRRIH